MFSQGKIHGDHTLTYIICFDKRRWMIWFESIRRLASVSKLQQELRLPVSIAISMSFEDVCAA